MAEKDNVLDLLFGDPFGRVYPPKENPRVLSVDGRTVALRILKRYLRELTFYLPGGRDPNTGKACADVPFRFREDDIHVEWPDNEEDLRFPSIVFLSTGAAKYDAIGLTTYVEEKTRDVYAPGTVLQWMSEFTENFVIEIWATKRAERRSVLAGIEAAVTPTEQMYGLRFRMPDYFNELVCFTAMGREIFDEPDAVRGRRRARINMEMRFNQVRLVNYAELAVITQVQTDIDMDEQGLVPNIPLGLAVVSVSPTTGSAAGGDTVVIAGRDFKAGSAVRFGSGFANSVVVNSPTQITCVTPVMSVGLQDVVVIDPSQGFDSGPSGAALYEST